MSGYNFELERRNSKLYRRFRNLQKKTEKWAYENLDAFGGEQINGVTHIIKHLLTDVVNAHDGISERLGYEDTWSPRWASAKHKYRRGRDALQIYFKLLQDFPDFRNGETKGFSYFSLQELGLKQASSLEYVLRAEKRLR